MINLESDYNIVVRLERTLIKETGWSKQKLEKMTLYDIYNLINALMSGDRM